MPTKYELHLSEALIAWARKFPRAASELFFDGDKYRDELWTAENDLAKHRREMSPDEIDRAEDMIAAEEARLEAVKQKEAA